MGENATEINYNKDILPEGNGKKSKGRFVAGIIFTVLSAVLFIALMTVIGAMRSQLKEVGNINDLGIAAVKIALFFYFLVGCGAFAVFDIVAIILNAGLIKRKAQKNVFVYGIVSTVVTATMIITVVAVLASILNGVADKEATLSVLNKLILV